MEELRGRNFAFVDPASTSGHLIPRALMMEGPVSSLTRT